jgi:hypothetical protein
MKAAALVLAAAMTTAAANAGAVEIWASDPDPIVYVTRPTYHYHYHPVDPVVVYTQTHVDVTDPVDPDDDAFDRLGLVEVGVGYGGFYMPSLAESLLQAPRGHLALILDPVSVNLDVSVATGLGWGERDEAGGCVAPGCACGEGELVQTSLGFAWRWNRHGVLHPTAGAGLELASLDPESGDSTFAFTAAAMAGLIFEYPLPYGALEAGLDTTAHVLLVSQDEYPLTDPIYLTFGGYVGFRF